MLDWDQDPGNGGVMDSAPDACLSDVKTQVSVTFTDSKSQAF